jgi:hypothetical protein
MYLGAIIIQHDYILKSLLQLYLQRPFPKQGCGHQLPVDLSLKSITGSNKLEIHSLSNKLTKPVDHIGAEFSEESPWAIRGCSQVKLEMN